MAFGCAFFIFVLIDIARVAHISQEKVGEITADGLRTRLASLSSIEVGLKLADCIDNNTPGFKLKKQKVSTWKHVRGHFEMQKDIGIIIIFGKKI